MRFAFFNPFRSAISSFQLSTETRQLYFKSPGQLFRLDAKIGHVRIAPDERMKWFDIHRGRPIRFPTMNPHGPRVPKLNRDNSRRGIGPEKQRVLLKLHPRDSAIFAPVTNGRDISGGSMVPGSQPTRLPLQG